MCVSVCFVMLTDSPNALIFLWKSSLFAFPDWQTRCSNIGEWKVNPPKTQRLECWPGQKASV